jgi:hypothetical protein
MNADVLRVDNNSYQVRLRLGRRCSCDSSDYEVLQWPIHGGEEKLNMTDLEKSIPIAPKLDHSEKVLLMCFYFTSLTKYVGSLIASKNRFPKKRGRQEVKGMPNQTVEMDRPIKASSTSWFTRLVRAAFRYVRLKNFIHS